MRKENTNSCETAGRSLAAGLLREGSAVKFRAEGLSMRPFLNCGDLLTVIPCTADQLRRGDIAAFTSADGELTVHRLLAIDRNKSQFGFRGDATCGELEMIEPDNILGRVVCVTNGSRTVYRDNALYRLAGMFWHCTGPMRKSIAAFRRKP